MIIGEDFIFFHMPRTGGTSVTHWMTESTADIRPPRGTLGNKWVTSFQHEGPFYLDELDCRQDRFWFAFIRNPFDWYVSYWAKFMNGISFGEWLHDVLNEKNMFNASRLLDFNIHYRFTYPGPQIYEMKWPGEDTKAGHAMIAKQVNSEGIKFDIGFMTHRYLQTCCVSPLVYFGKEPSWINRHSDILLMDKVYRYEDGIASGLEDAMGGDVGTLSWVNRGERKPYQEYYDQELIDLVYYKDRFIFEAYGYTF